MAVRNYLKLRGAVDLLRSAINHVTRNPSEPDWYAPLVDKSGHAKPVQDALDILNEAWRAVRFERDAAR